MPICMPWLSITEPVMDEIKKVEWNEIAWTEFHQSNQASFHYQVMCFTILRHIRAT